MEYEGYEIIEDGDGTFRVVIGDKVVGVGYSTEETAQEAVISRRRRRTILSKDPVG